MVIDAEKIVFEEKCHFTIIGLNTILDFHWGKNKSFSYNWDKQMILQTNFQQWYSNLRSRELYNFFINHIVALMQ